jgi:hypothetical protein
MTCGAFDSRWRAAWKTVVPASRIRLWFGRIRSAHARPIHSFSHRSSSAVVEHLVRQAVYSRLWANRCRVRRAAPNPLVVNISARHCHLTQEAVEASVRQGHKLTQVHKWLYQEGQFAAKETVTLIGPRSRVISNLRILGPCRNLNQVELAYTDAIALGFDIPLRVPVTSRARRGAC